MINALTFDLEDWFEGLDQNPDHWDERFQPRVEFATDKVLRILARHNTKATFFVLGYLADRFPGLIEKIFQQGHELAVHGYHHNFVYHQSRQQFRDEVVRTKQAVESITGQPVIGFRAPYFSITKSSLWALDELADLGFVYDSSIFPIHNHRYGIPSANPNPHMCDLKGDRRLVEFPISTVRLLGNNWPFSGGVYFRFFNYHLIKRGFRSVNRGGRPVVVYLHPWEFDAEQPRYNRIPITLRLRHYYALGKTEKKLDRLLRDFSFQPLGQMVDGVVNETPH